MEDVSNSEPRASAADRGDGAGGPGRRVDACFHQAEVDVAEKSCSVQWFVRRRPAEEDEVVLQLQTRLLLQNEFTGQMLKSSFQGLT